MNDYNTIKKKEIKFSMWMKAFDGEIYVFLYLIVFFL